MDEGRGTTASEATRELFRYYAEQARHTENLWLNTCRYFAALLAAIVATTLGFLEWAEPESARRLIGAMALLGLFVSLLALTIVHGYVQLVQQWVDHKRLIEERLFPVAGLKADWDQRVATAYARKQGLMLLPASQWLFAFTVVVFVIALFLALLFPHTLTGLSEGPG